MSIFKKIKSWFFKEKLGADLPIFTPYASSGFSELPTEKDMRTSASKTAGEHAGTDRHAMVDDLHEGVKRQRKEIIDARDKKTGNAKSALKDYEDKLDKLEIRHGLNDNNEESQPLFDKSRYSRMLSDFRNDVKGILVAKRELNGFLAEHNLSRSSKDGKRPVWIIVALIFALEIVLAANQLREFYAILPALVFAFIIGAVGVAGGIGVGTGARFLVYWRYISIIEIFFAGILSFLAGIIIFFGANYTLLAFRAGEKTATIGSEGNSGQAFSNPAMVFDSLTSLELGLISLSCLTFGFAVVHFYSEFGTREPNPNLWSKMKAAQKAQEAVDEKYKKIAKDAERDLNAEDQNIKTAKKLCAIIDDRIEALMTNWRQGNEAAKVDSDAVLTKGEALLDIYFKGYNVARQNLKRGGLTTERFEEWCAKLDDLKYGDQETESDEQAATSIKNLAESVREQSERLEAHLKRKENNAQKRKNDHYQNINAEFEKTEDDVGKEQLG